MKPYYDEGGITIYHGDCREILPFLPEPTLLLADPPYGIGYQLPSGVVGTSRRRGLRRGHPPMFGDDAPFDPSHLLGYRRCVLFGANHYADRLPASGAWIVWDKTGGGRGPRDSFADVELAWSNIGSTPRICHHLWKGLVRASEAGQVVLHPTQKPVALMAWIITEHTQPGELVIDPYMGSGPVLRAAKDLGRRAIGIEIEERYCEIAAKRLAQEVLPLGGEA